MTPNQIDVSYDKKRQISRGLDLKMEKGELVSLLGPSGYGKSITLRVVTGFINPQGGTFSLDGEDMTKVPVHRRNSGLVFQNYALFPHLGVYDNMTFGLCTRKMDKAVVDAKVKDILEVCGLTGFAQRSPKQMSGGQRQRVALTRTLVIEPKLLLLDEPLGNLDARLGIGMRVEIKHPQKELGIITLLVTHGQERCFSISDKVAVMNNGMIEQHDSSENVYIGPATEFVVRFVSFENFLELEHSGNHECRVRDDSRFQVDMEWDGPDFAGATKPDDIRLAEPGQQGDVLIGMVGVRTFLGKGYQYEVDTASGVLKMNMDISHVFKGGEELRLYLLKDKLVLVGR